MLLGQYAGILSSKRRVAIPKKFRDELGRKPILGKWYEGCLVLVSVQGWQELLKRLTGEARVVTLPVRDTDRFILGSAFELEPDDQGRIIVPEPLAGYAGLSKELLFIGLGERVEIWDKQVWTEREEYIAKHASEMIEKVASDLKKEVGRDRNS